MGGACIPRRDHAATKPSAVVCLLTSGRPVCSSCACNVRLLGPNYPPAEDRLHATVKIAKIFHFEKWLRVQGLITRSAARSLYIFLSRFNYG